MIWVPEFQHLRMTTADQRFSASLKRAEFAGYYIETVTDLFAYLSDEAAKHIARDASIALASLLARRTPECAVDIS